MKSRIIYNKYFLRVFWILVFIAAWEVLATSKVFNSASFPDVGTIFNSLITDVTRGDIISHTFYSLSLIFRGLIIGVLLAVILSGLSMLSKIFEGLVESLVAIAHPLPGIALLPLVILWIGIGDSAIVFIIVHSVLWPMILNLLAGFRSIPKIYNQIGRNYGLKPLGIVRYILLPASFPYFLAGIKIGWARAWRAAISAEMVFGAAGGIGGLGWFIFKKRVFMDSPGLFAGIIVIVLIGIIVEDLLFNKLEKATIKKWGMSI